MKIFKFAFLVSVATALLLNDKTRADTEEICLFIPPSLDGIPMTIGCYDVGGHDWGGDDMQLYCVPDMGVGDIECFLDSTKICMFIGKHNITS